MNRSKKATGEKISVLYRGLGFCRISSADLWFSGCLVRGFFHLHVCLQPVVTSERTDLSKQHRPFSAYNVEERLGNAAITVSLYHRKHIPRGRGVQQAEMVTADRSWRSESSILQNWTYQSTAAKNSQERVLLRGVCFACYTRTISWRSQLAYARISHNHFDVSNAQHPTWVKPNLSHDLGIQEFKENIELRT